MLLCFCFVFMFSIYRFILHAVQVPQLFLFFFWFCHVNYPNLVHICGYKLPITGQNLADW